MCVGDVAHVDIGKRTHVPVCAIGCKMVCARGDTRRMQARPAASRTASPVYELSEGGEDSASDDRMSLERLCATCRAARVHARRASDHSCEPAAASSALRRLQSLHWPLTRRWAQMEAPPQFLHLLLTRLCSQMEVPPQSLHWPLTRLCWQAPPQSLHRLPCHASRLCSQMAVPLQSLHPLLTRSCSQMEAPPQSAS